MKYFFPAALLLAATFVSAAPYPVGGDDRQPMKFVGNLENPKKSTGVGADKKNAVMDTLKDEPIHTGNPGITVIGNKFNDKGEIVDSNGNPIKGNKKPLQRRSGRDGERHKLAGNLENPKKSEGKGAKEKNDAMETLKGEPIHRGNPGINVVGNKVDANGKIIRRGGGKDGERHRIQGNLENPKKSEGKGAKEKNEAMETLKGEPIHQGNKGINVVGNKVDSNGKIIRRGKIVSDLQNFKPSGKKEDAAKDAAMETLKGEPVHTGNPGINVIGNRFNDKGQIVDANGNVILSQSERAKINRRGDDKPEEKKKDEKKEEKNNSGWHSRWVF